MNREKEPASQVTTRSESSGSLSSALSSALFSNISSQATTAATSDIELHAGSPTLTFIDYLFMLPDAGLSSQQKRVYKSELVPLLIAQLRRCSYATSYHIQLCSAGLTKSALSPAILISVQKCEKCQNHKKCKQCKAKRKIKSHLENVSQVADTLTRYDLTLHVVHDGVKEAGAQVNVGGTTSTAYLVPPRGCDSLCRSNIIIPQEISDKSSNCTSGLIWEVGGRLYIKTPLHPWPNATSPADDGSSSDNDDEDDDDDESGEGLPMSIYPSNINPWDALGMDDAAYSSSDDDVLELGCDSTSYYNHKLAPHSTITLQRAETAVVVSSQRFSGVVEPTYVGHETDWTLCDAQQAAPELSADALSRNEIGGYRITKFHQQDPEARMPVIVATHEGEVHGTTEPGEVFWVSRGRVYEMRLVTLNEPLKPGASGATVTHKDGYLGTIQVVRENVPWAYMIPVELELKEMEAVCGLPVSLPHADTILTNDTELEQRCASAAPHPIQRSLPGPRSSSHTNNELVQDPVVIATQEDPADSAKEAIELNARLESGYGIHSSHVGSVSGRDLNSGQEKHEDRAGFYSKFTSSHGTPSLREATSPPQRAALPPVSLSPLEHSCTQSGQAKFLSDHVTELVTDWPPVPLLTEKSGVDMQGQNEDKAQLQSSNDALASMAQTDLPSDEHVAPHAQLPLSHQRDGSGGDSDSRLCRHPPMSRRPSTYPLLMRSYMKCETRQVSKSIRDPEFSEPGAEEKSTESQRTRRRSVGANIQNGLDIQKVFHDSGDDGSKESLWLESPLKNVPHDPPSRDDWDRFKSVIVEQLFGKNMALRELRIFMDTEHRFRASERMYKRRFSDWAVHKHHMAASRRVKSARIMAETIFSLNGFQKRVMASTIENIVFYRSLKYRQQSDVTGVQKSTSLLQATLDTLSPDFGPDVETLRWQETYKILFPNRIGSVTDTIASEAKQLLGSIQHLPRIQPRIERVIPTWVPSCENHHDVQPDNIVLITEQLKPTHSIIPHLGDHPRDHGDQILMTPLKVAARAGLRRTAIEMSLHAAAVKDNKQHCTASKPLVGYLLAVNNAILSHPEERFEKHYFDRRWVFQEIALLRNFSKQLPDKILAAHLSTPQPKGTYGRFNSKRLWPPQLGFDAIPSQSSNKGELILSQLKSRQRESTTCSAKSPHASNDRAEVIAPLTHDRVIIAVMGITGAGKSEFIHRVMNEDIKTDLGWGTYQLRAVTIGGRKVSLVDTPGFSDTPQKSDQEILRGITTWLELSSLSVNALFGVLHHQLAYKDTASRLAKNKEMFKKVCEKKSAFTNVMLDECCLWRAFLEKICEEYDLHTFDEEDSKLLKHSRSFALESSVARLLLQLLGACAKMKGYEASRLKDGSNTQDDEIFAWLQDVDASLRPSIDDA